MNAVILTFKYRSRDRMCIFIFNAIMRMILYALITTYKHLFWIVISFLTELLAHCYHVAVIVFSFKSEYHIAVSCVIISLITALYIWHVITRVILHVEIKMQVSMLIWIFILFIIFLMCSSHCNLKFTLTFSTHTDDLSVRASFSTWSKTFMLNL